MPVAVVRVGVLVRLGVGLELGVAGVIVVRDRVVVMPVRAGVRPKDSCSPGRRRVSVAPHRTEG